MFSKILQSDSLFLIENIQFHCLNRGNPFLEILEKDRFLFIKKNPRSKIVQMINVIKII